MDPETTTPTPAEETALPIDEFSPEYAGLLASWKMGDQTGTKPAATAAAAATAEEAVADDPEENQEEYKNAGDDAGTADESPPAKEGEGEEQGEGGPMRGRTGSRARGKW